VGAPPKRRKPKNVAPADWTPEKGAAKLPAVFERLREMYGARRWRPHQEPIDELILTILSQRNTDRSTEQSYLTLRERFPTWEQVMLAPVEEVTDAIRWSGLYEMKAPRIQGVLRTINEERGSFDLRFLKEMSLDEAKAWLKALPGVGPKTTAIVLLFSLGMPAFPVDTHVYRVSQRLGLVGPKTSEAKAHDVLEAMLAPSQMFEFHVNMIAHGRRICHAIGPKCENCPLLSLCPFGQARLGMTPPGMEDPPPDA
jgi:endonuclease-3